jgi:hypothetical protein
VVTQKQLDDAQAYCAHSERLSRRADAALDIIFACILAVLGALVVMHFAMPCEVGTLCAFPAFLFESPTSESIAADEKHAYMQGWRWGAVCGITAGGAMVAAAFLIGLAAA